ncbi:MAG: Jag N-terminal domain-containing protein [Deltaproteobacteria bacterium]|jgi:spoIIIJ-associated protein|nr:Jag N-terminal domain-containing protein [Deltaproteobacteria bacterium]
MPNEYKEFTGKNLDDAMAAACSFYGVERGKLEIEILSDAKSGIFGLVGAKKAVVLARRMRMANLDLGVDKTKPSSPGELKNTEKESEDACRPPVKTRPKQEEKEQPPGSFTPRKEKTPTRGKTSAPHPVEETMPPFDPDKEHGLPAASVHLKDLDQVLLKKAVLEAVNILSRPLLDTREEDPTLDVAEEKVLVRLHSNADCGLLIGRNGQTLSALQYLVNCIVCRRMGVSVPVRIDAGNYRERQAEKLRELAVYLASKVKESGRSQSSRPLSPYQRRIIHMTLQDDPEVQTYSKGEGELKRVVVAQARHR